MIRAQLHRALPWLILAMTVVLAACNNGGSGGSGPAY
jgi:predicted small secreted protein